MGRVRSSLREVRQQHGLQQQELAARAGISRQALSELEAGHACPSTAVALALARVLRCSVEDLFALAEDAEPLRAEWALLEAPEQAARESGGHRASSARAAPTPRRAAVVFIDGRWVAHPLTANQPASMCMAADALAMSSRAGAKPARGRKARLQPLRSRSALRENVLAAGCDPAMGLLAAWLGERRAGLKLTWLYAPSHEALGALGRREIHVAGAHLWDEASGEFNIPFARSTVGAGSAVVVNLGRWEEGLVVARGNPLGIRGVNDLVRPDVAFVNREVGSEARKLIDRLLRKEGLEARAVKGFERVARGHAAVAQAVALGAADVGIATRIAAAGLGLSFLPLSEERFDLVLPKQLFADGRAGRLIDAIASRAFRRELQSLGGYATDRSGEVIAEVGPR